MTAGSGGYHLQANRSREKLTQLLLLRQGGVIISQKNYHSNLID
jgi:hypothetical protein